MARVCQVDACDDLAHEFSNIFNDRSYRYTWSQVTMLQGKPLGFSDFYRFAAFAANINTFFVSEGGWLF